MKSRITIEMDFDTSRPYIKISKVNSDDVRDKILGYFLELLGHSSSWCKIQWDGVQPGDGSQKIRIVPVRPEQFKEEAEEILHRARIEDEVSPPQKGE